MTIFLTISECAQLLRLSERSVYGMAREVAMPGERALDFLCSTSDHGEKFWEQGGYEHGQPGTRGPPDGRGSGSGEIH